MQPQQKAGWRKNPDQEWTWPMEAPTWWPRRVGQKAGERQRGVLLSVLPRSLWQAKENAGRSVRSLEKVQGRDSSGWATQCNGDVGDLSY